MIELAYFDIQYIFMLIYYIIELVTHQGQSKRDSNKNIFVIMIY